MVADHSKLGVVALAKIASLSKVDVFVTDEGADAEILRGIELAGVRVIVAESSGGPLAPSLLLPGGAAAGRGEAQAQDHASRNDHHQSPPQVHVKAEVTLGPRSGREQPG